VRRRKVDLELLTCAWHGHALGTGGAAGRRPDPVLVRETADGLQWYRCLRCDAWIPSRKPLEQGVAAADRSEITVPERGRALRDRYVLRLIALDRVLHFLLLGVAAAAVMVFAADRSRVSGPFYRVVDALQNGVGGAGARPGTGLIGELEKGFEARASHLWLLGGILAAYALLEGVEAVGLWRARRWAEYLTFVATTVLLVPEVWELTHRVTVFKITALVVNVAVVAYLLYAKRLFGLRGGARAEQRERDEDMSWQALERATP
jgi:uncharacterized membrane protein (DUF2068 family)